MVLHRHGTMVADRWVRVVANDVDGSITGIPCWRNGVPNPNQVAQVVVDGQTLIDNCVKRFAGFWAESTPPEPAAFGFVEGSPEDRNAGGLETEELDGDGIDVADEEGVVGTGGDEGGGEVEGCGIGVEAGPPFHGVVVDEVTDGLLGGCR